MINIGMIDLDENKLHFMYINGEKIKDSLFYVLKIENEDKIIVKKKGSLYMDIFLIEHKDGNKILIKHPKNQEKYILELAEEKEI